MTRAARARGIPKEPARSSPHLRQADPPGLSPHPDAERVLRLQRAAGNASMTALVRPSVPPSADRPITVQRHDSFEHRLLGDASPWDLERMTGKLGRAERLHTLEQELKRLHLWLEKAPEQVSERDLRARWPSVRVFTLRNGLAMTYGELNTMGDYMANPAAIDAAPREVILPILQSVRQESFNRLTDLVVKARNPLADPADYHAAVPGAIPAAGEEGTIAAIQQVSELNEVTGSLGTNQYQSLVARNACHFAPFNWQRWEEFHSRARELAEKGHRERNSELIRQAWLNNGYADHFLEDAFAAGHLINKTLVMQWFVEYVERYNAQMEAAGLADNEIHLEHWEQIRTMSSQEQPQLSAPGLYGSSRQSTDPQTAEEEATPQARRQASGVRATSTLSQQQAYRNYLAFLNSAAVQKASGDLHNHFNKAGLTVSSKAHPQAYRIYGDSSLLLHDDGAEGAKVSASTARLSQGAIADLSRSGTTAISVQQIHDCFPDTIHTEAGAVLSLVDWHKDLKAYCFSHLFGPFMASVVDTLGPHMGHVSVDAPVATPGTFEWGDTMIRDWVKAHDAQAIDRQPLEEKLRMINRLLDGWVSDADVDALETICASVSSPQEMAEISMKIAPRLNSLTNLGQRTRVEIAIRRKATAPAPAR